MNILDKIVEKTKERAGALNLSELKSAALAAPSRREFIFEKALLNEKISIIAEIKKASPSKGLICPDFRPIEIAKEYKKANVDCISVLTEPFFFSGDNSYVEQVKNASGKPVLRKDFITDAAQIYESFLINADCILLICAILEEEKLREYLEIAHGLGLCVLVEAHDENEIKKALNSGARIIGVNNRNLKTFEVDFENSLRLRKMVPKEIIFVSESGIKTREDIERLENAGVSAVLIGETFMRAKDKPAQIRELRGF